METARSYKTFNDLRLLRRVDLGNDKVDVIEDEECRTTKRTGIYAGIELQFFFRQPYYDERLKSGEANFFFDFGQKGIPIDDEEKWKQLISAVPYTLAARRKAIVECIHAKCKTSDPDLHKEAMHALWELAIDKSFNHEIDAHTLEHVAECLKSEDFEVLKSILGCLEKLLSV